METNDIVRLILSDNKELEKSTRYYNLSLEKKVDVIISQRPELKNCLIADVDETCDHNGTTQWITSKIMYCTKCHEHRE